MRQENRGQGSRIRGRHALVLALLLAVPGMAQQAAPPAQPPAGQKPAEAAPAAQAPAAEQKTEAKAEEKAASPAPATESWLTGYLDLGYRWVNNYGNTPEYRSVVNLPEGPRVLGFDFTVQDPKKRAFDVLTVRGMGWGGDPYTTAYLDARKRKLYELRLDYRNIAYYNAVPSFANPSAPAGFNEQSFDIRQRDTSFELDLFPGSRIIPYLAYDRNTHGGLGIEDWVQGATNNYPVPYNMRDWTNNFRGGVRLEFPRWHITLEEGGTKFREDDSSGWTGSNPGDRPTPVSGAPLVLNSLQQAYGIRSDGIYSKVLLTANPLNWINLYGSFLYSEPKTDVTYAELGGGRFVDFATALLYGGQYGIGTGSAVQPHVSGQWGFELNPGKRVRVMESVTIDRFHDASVGLFTTSLYQSLAGNQAPLSTSLASLNPQQVVNYQQQQTDVFFDVTNNLTLRGGFRYLWGDATVLAGPLSQTGPFASGSLQRLIGTAGATYRAGQKLTVNADYEGSSSDDVYFRTSLNNYHKARMRAKYQATSSLLLQANFQVLSNQNPAADIQMDYLARDNSLAFFWTPAAAKRITITGEYDRSTIHSNIRYLDLPFFNSAISAYRDNAHTATTTIEVQLPHMTGGKLVAGGSLMINSGSRPTQYYQPLAQLLVPVYKHLFWNTTWQYYGFGENFYFFEAFRANIIMTGIRFSR